MGANRYTNTHFGIARQAVEWDVEIYDDLGTPVGTFAIIGRDGVSLTSEGPTRDLLPGVYPTTARFTFTVNDAQQRLLIEDIWELDRSRFAVRIYKNGVLVFIGRFGQHDMKIENSPMPYPVTITAKCGLSDLKQIKYEQSATVAYTGKDTFLEHIKKCFDKLDIQPFYISDFIDFTVNWFHEDHVDTSTNPLEVSRVDHLVFRKDSDSMSCWDVLERIAICWGCRIFYSEGLFHVEQISERVTSSYDRWVYDTSFTETASSGSVTNDITVSAGGSASQTDGTGPLATGYFGVLDNLKAVDVALEVENGNLAAGYTWDYNDQTAKQIGTIKIEDLTELIELKGVFELQSTLLGAQWVDHRYVWIVKVTLDNGAGTVFNIERELDMPPFYTEVPTLNGSFITPQYDTVADITTLGVDYVEVAGPFMFEALDGTVVKLLQSGGNPVWTLLSEPFEDTTITINVGDRFDVSMQVYLDKVVAANGDNITTDFANWNYKWWFRNPSFRVTDEEGSQQSKTIKIHHIKTNDLEAERTLEITSYIGDVPNKQNGIEVYDGTNWAYSTARWGVGTTAGTKAISLLLATEMMKIRRTAKETYNGAFITHEMANNARIYYKNKYWLPIRTNIISGQDLIDGYFVELEADDLSGTTDGEVIVQDPNELPTQTPYNPPDGPPVQTPADPPGLITDEPLDTISSYTTVDVVNNAGIELSAGTWIQILNLSTGQTEVVQLTADLGAADTSISISSTTFSNEFPSGSPIGIAEVTLFDWVEEEFEVSAADASNNYVTVTGPLSDPAAYSTDRVYFRNTLVYRGATQVFFSSAATSAMKSHQYGVVKASERITFPDNWGLYQGEIIIVRYKIPRS